MIEDEWASAVADLLDLTDAVLNRPEHEARGLAEQIASEYGDYADDQDVAGKRRT